MGVFGRGSRLGSRIEALLAIRTKPRFPAARTIAGVAALIGLAAAGSLAPRWIVFAQARPAFEVASVRLTSAESPANPPGSGIPVRQINAGNLTYANVAMIEYIELAYELKPYQIAEPHPPVLVEHYDINARAGSAVPGAQTRLMLQTLLEDRFKLRFHLEKRELPVYTLRVAKNGPRFPRGDEDGLRLFDRLPEGIRWRNTTLDYLAGWISNLPSLGRPVLDRTGLTGKYDLLLSLDPVANPTGGKGDIVSALDSSVIPALQRLGLRLEAEKTPIETMVIEHVERPDAN